MRVTRASFAHAVELLSALLRFSGPADETVSRYFREHRELGQQDRAFVAETVFGVLRRMRSLEAAAGSAQAAHLCAAAALRLVGLSARALEGIVDAALASRIKAFAFEELSGAVRADLPDWLWVQLVEQYGEEEAQRIAQGLAAPAPLDLRVNLARVGREDVLARLAEEELKAEPTPFAPAGLRLWGRPPINRHPLFQEGLVEVQDEGSQLLAWLVAPRRGEMVGDYCAGAGGKTLALAMLMRGSGRIYAMDVSSRRLAALAPRAARAGFTNIHTIVLSGEQDARAKRLAGKLDRVLVDAPCSGFGTLRRNPDLKWRQRRQDIDELVAKQRDILQAAARLVKPGGRLVYATCSILQAENEAVADAFAVANPRFSTRSCETLLEEQRIALRTGPRLRLWPHVHGTDGFFAAAFERDAAAW